MARLANWAENTIKVVDEKGDATARIRLVSADGSTWQTWDAPFPEPEEWVTQAEELCSELSEDFAGEVHCMFIAESASGTIRSQCPRRIAGKQRKGANGAGAFGSQGAPLQAMYEAQARTVEKTLQSANVQLEVLTRTVETQAKANGELLDFIRVRNEHEALDRQEGENDVQKMLGQLMEQAPLLLELVATKKKATKAAAQPLAEKVAGAVSETVKEAAVTAASNGAAQLVQAVTPKGT